jgi:hypothetical protein
VRCTFKSNRYCLLHTITLFAEIGNYFGKIHKKSATLEGI